MSDGPQHDPGETQPVQPPESTRPMPANPWRVPPYQEREGNGEYSVQQPGQPPGQPPAPPHYPPGQYPSTPNSPYPGTPYSCTPYPGTPYPGTPYPPQPPGQAYGYPVYGPPPAYSQRGLAIAALVVNIVLVLMTCLLGLPSIAGAIVSGIAIAAAGRDPARAGTLVKWGWGLAISTVVLGILLVVLVTMAGAD
jgi:hypothetical protein